jgi:hypothetical protein
VSRIKKLRLAYSSCRSAYRNGDYAAYVLRHDDTCRIDALLAVRQLKGFEGDDYLRVVKQLRDDGCEPQRVDTWALLSHPGSKEV